MKMVIALSALALGLGAGVGHAQVFNSTLGFGGVEPDIGCIRGAQVGSRFPTNLYDARTNERILMNISRCTGGYITGTNEATGVHWNADIFSDGTSRGRDADGDRWRYDPKARRFLNLATNVSCSHTDLRHVCAEAR
jgi:hypothetical protein